MLALLLAAGWNDTAYYPSLADMQSSLTIRNSSSSLFTLRTMAWVSLFVPFVAAYIWYAWRALNRRPITRDEIRGDGHQYCTQTGRNAPAEAPAARRHPPPVRACRHIRPDMKRP